MGEPQPCGGLSLCCCSSYSRERSWVEGLEELAGAAPHRHHGTHPARLPSPCLGSPWQPTEHATARPRLRKGRYGSAWEGRGAHSRTRPAPEALP